MKNNILAVCGAVVFAGLTVSAQQPPPPQPQPQPQPTTPPTQQTPPPQPQPTTRPPQQTPPAQRPPDPYPSTPSTRTPVDVAGAITLTGCLKTWDSRTTAPARGAGSGAGSAATPPSGSKEFVLTNVEKSEASRAANVAGSSFIVTTSDPTVVLSQHLNHKVALTGTVSDAAGEIGRPTDRNSDSPTADKPSPSASDAATGRGPSDMKMPTLNVTALKMISPTCGS